MSDLDLIYGLHSARAALAYDPARVTEAWLDKRRRDARLQRLREKLRAAGCAMHEVEVRDLRRLVGEVAHQGVVLRYAGTTPQDASDLDDFLDRMAGPPLLLVLDQVQDPHNLGACLRAADGGGVDAVIVPRDRAVGLTPVVRKVAAGAAEAMPFFQVTNLARCLRELKDRGIWLIGAADEAEQSLYSVDLTGPLALVLGAEDKGLRRLTREHCDVLVSLPMAGTVESLNVSVATGVTVYEAWRQRHPLNPGAH